MKLENIPLNLRDNIDEVVTLLAPTAHKKGLDVYTKIDTDVPTKLLGDPLRVKQVLTNLISNAIKFTNEGSISIHCKLTKLKDNQALITLHVIDTGIGMEHL